MTVLTKILPFGGALALLVLAIPMAHGQTAKSSLGTSALAKSAGMASNGGGKWTCMSRQTVEIAPVSSDVRSQKDSWLVVYRDKGEVIAAEHVNEREAAQIRQMPCGGRDSELGGIAIG